MRHAWAIAASTFFVHVSASAFGVYWLDSGELSVAVAQFGVPHPPGAPGYALFGQFLTMLPIATIAHRVAALSALGVAIAVGLLSDLLAQRGVSPALRWFFAAHAAVALTIARNASVAEIYGYAMMLWALVTWALFSRPDGERLRWGIFAAVVAALGFADLRLLFGLVLPVIAWRQFRRDRSQLWGFAGMGLLAASLVLMLAYSGAQPVWGNWGEPNTWVRLWDHVDARSIRASFADRMWESTWARRLVDARQAGERLLEDLGLLVPAIALWGIWRLDRKKARGAMEPSDAEVDVPAERPLRPLLYYLATTIVLEFGYAWLINPMGGVDRQTGAIAALALLFCAVLTLGCTQWSGVQNRGARIAFVALSLSWPASWGWFQRPVTRSEFPREWTAYILDSAPPNAVILSQSDDLAAGAGAARVLEGVRPDVTVVPAQHLYRQPPAWVDSSSMLFEAWRRAQRENSDNARISAFASGWEGPLGLESAGTMLFASLEQVFPRWSLGIEGRGASDHSDAQLDEDLERWRSRAESVEDRQRIARVLDTQARRELREGGAAAGSEALLRYQWTLEHVEPSYGPALVNAATLALGRGHREAAQKWSQQAVECWPGRVSAWSIWAAAHFEDNPKAAKRALRYALTLDPQHAASLKRWKKWCKTPFPDGCEASKSIWNFLAPSLSNE